ncbi:MAG: sugar phosphorylase [Balneolaceae bacterium]
MDDSIFCDGTIERLKRHFAIIYGEHFVDDCIDRVKKLIDKFQLEPQLPLPPEAIWTHEDLVLITYGDMVQPQMREQVTKLKKLHQFLKNELENVISTIHILPFFPSSSDDGFSVIDYRRVSELLGGWDDINEMSREFRVMGDLVMNHTSRHSKWFDEFLEGNTPYNQYFMETDPEIDLSMVTRPRSSPLLTPVHTNDGEKYVWSTFSNDQIDVNFANPDVLFEFLDIYFFYLSQGLSIIRLDAVAFIWKEIGTNCIHLKETHEIVKLIRTLVDCFAPHSTIITETNVPHKENISYFGEGDEAHMVYQFSLPPLLLHAILTENAFYLTEWLKSLKPLPKGCTYFNFTSSHDGIGVRPLEGLVPESEFDHLVDGIKKKGGFVSEKKNPNGTLSPYELNITYFDAFSGLNGSKSLQIRRFICSQIICMSLKGVPGLYFHNFTGTRNNLEGVSITGKYRTINRKKWFYDELVNRINDPVDVANVVFDLMKKIIHCRRSIKAFNPYGSQLVYDTNSDLFCLLRKDPKNEERVLVLANLTGKIKVVDTVDYSIPIDVHKEYADLLSGRSCIVNGKGKLEPYQVIWVRI